MPLLFRRSKRTSVEERQRITSFALFLLFPTRLSPRRACLKAELHIILEIRKISPIGRIYGRVGLRCDREERKKRQQKVFLLSSLSFHSPHFTLFPPSTITSKTTLLQQKAHDSGLGTRMVTPLSLGPEGEGAAAPFPEGRESCGNDHHESDSSCPQGRGFESHWMHSSNTFLLYVVT